MGRKIYNFEGSDSISVSEYLGSLNETLEENRSRIVGEACNVKLYPGRSYMYFSVKDKEKEAMLNCFMWKRDYSLSGVELAEGLEVIIEGFPKIYEPNGSLSFQTESVELVGEGALKAAYDKLKLKLETEGILAPERKRRVPDYPQKIGVITSRDGAVLSDFRSNIGHFGYRLSFVNSKVEGQKAVKDLLAAVKTLRTADIDVLVIMRGGGSLESFAAFNNELLVREIANFPVPVVAGIGHDKDICLAALAADVMVSTPTAVAEHLNTSWNLALSKVRLLERELAGMFSRALSRKELELVRMTSRIRESFAKVFESFREMENSFTAGAKRIEYSFREMRKEVLGCSREIVHAFAKKTAQAEHSIALREKELVLFDPERQLRRGFSLVRHGGKIMRSARELAVGENLNIISSDGEAVAEIIEINLK